MDGWMGVILFMLIFGGGYWAFLKVGKRAVTRQLSKQEEADPWADFKRLASEVRTRKAKELAEWQAEFQAILRKTCKHRYNGNEWNDWWKCLDCGYEQEWEYSGGCSCRVAHDRSITGQPFIALIERSRSCTIHGRTIVVEAAQKLRDGYSGGGYLGLHNDRYIR